MPTNRKGHSAVVIGSAMLVYGGFIDMKGSSQDFWSLDCGEIKVDFTLIKNSNCFEISANTGPLGVTPDSADAPEWNIMRLRV